MTEPHSPRYGTIDRDYGMRLASTPADEDGPVWLVNLMKYRERANYADGRESSISGRDADDLYTPLESLAAVGAEPAFFGDVEQQLLGDDTVWDRIGVVKYPTRKAFIEMQSLPGFQESHHHKEASEAAKVALRHGVRISGWFAVEGTIIGDGRAWHQVRFNLFPSRAAFMAVVTDPARLAAQQDHREVAIADTYTTIVRPTVDRLAESVES